MGKQPVKRTGKGGKKVQPSTEKDAYNKAYRQDACDTGKIMEQIYMLVALGRCSWFGQKRRKELNEILSEVRDEYVNLVLEDSKSDKHWEYTKTKMFTELYHAVGLEYDPKIINPVEWNDIFNLDQYTGGIRIMQLVERKRTAKKIAEAATKHLLEME